MKTFRVLMTQSAAQDLKDISSYIAYDLKEPLVAKRFVKEIKTSVMSLAELPLRHNLVSDENLATQGLRKIMVGNYIIFYIVSEMDETVSVVRILYGRRDWIHLL
ncbi:MAG TPA: type II toxin-antitoxin system RelE/ParE family toxin [Spirochaetia bacterium]|nr:type II toxin-antitoxin system RelE/ParE family toxin [Spirochaetia bacterium]